MQGFILALLLTSVFHEGLSFMTIGNNPTCFRKLVIATGGFIWVGCCKPPILGSRGNALRSFGYFTDSTFSSSLSRVSINSLSQNDPAVYSMMSDN